MTFSIKEWRKFYDEVHRLGQILKDSYDSMDDNKQWVEPKHPLDRDTQKTIENQIKEILEECRYYLDFHQIPYPRQLWKYKHNDPTTHLSHKLFKYGLLLKMNNNYE